MTILGQDEEETDGKNWTSRNSASELMNPLENGKKIIQAFESLNSDVRARSQAQITILGLLEEEDTGAKNWSARNSAFELTNPVEMVKKLIQAFESLNYDVRARSQSQMTILGLDEQETDAKNRPSKNLASELTNPLEMVKKKHVGLLNGSILMSELGVRPKLRFWAQMMSKHTRKIGLQGIHLLSSQTSSKW